MHMEIESPVIYFEIAVKRFFFAPLIFLVLALPLRATDYTWETTTGGGAQFTSAAGWSPAGGPPTSSDNIVGQVNNATQLNLSGTLQVNDFTVTDTSAFSVVGSANGSSLTLNTLTDNGNGNFVIRQSSAGNSLAFTANTINLSGADSGVVLVLSLGFTPANGMAPDEGLSGLTINDGINFGANNSTVRVNANGNSYSLGLITTSASTGTATLDLGYSTISNYTFTANAAGLSSAAGSKLKIYGSVSTAFQTVTLALNTGSNSYSTNGILADNNGGTSVGTLALTKSGTGTQTLSGASTYTGGTTVNQGVLAVTNSTGSGLGSGAVQVNSGGTLAGTGIVAPTAGNNITVASGGVLSPGLLGSGTLTLNLSSGSVLALNSGSTLELNLGTSSSSLSFNSVGDWLNGSSGNTTLVLTEGSGFSYSDSYTIFSNVSTTGFSFASITGYDSTDYTALLNQSGTNYILSFQASAVPEPNVMALLAGGLALLAWVGIKRRPSARAAL